MYLSISPKVLLQKLKNPNRNTLSRSKFEEIFIVSNYSIFLADIYVFIDVVQLTHDL